MNEPWKAISLNTEYTTVLALQRHPILNATTIPQLISNFTISYPYRFKIFARRNAADPPTSSYLLKQFFRPVSLKHSPCHSMPFLKSLED